MHTNCRCRGGGKNSLWGKSVVIDTPAVAWNVCRDFRHFTSETITKNVLYGNKWSCSMCRGLGNYRDKIKYYIYNVWGRHKWAHVCLRTNWCNRA